MIDRPNRGMQAQIDQFNTAQIAACKQQNLLYTQSCLGNAVINPPIERKEEQTKDNFWLGACLGLLFGWWIA